MNAIDILVEDHKTVEKLLEELASTTDRAVKKRGDLLSRIEQELKVHTELEEQILYPALKEAGGKEEEKMYYEAKEEHRTVDSLVLPDLLHTETDTVEFAGRVKVMKELLEHHIEEEEGKFFPTAKKLLGKDVLDEMGLAMQEYKKTLKTQHSAKQSI
ncbi:hemerythrin domain-containing protein [Pseudomonas sp. GZD-209]|uniref:hemerythrin domain-containing protein n=1 Tax=Pseudomonas sp. GZD-209 TaxID=3404807 RepID=UPI003BB5D447